MNQENHFTYKAFTYKKQVVKTLYDNEYNITYIAGDDIRRITNITEDYIIDTMSTDNMLDVMDRIDYEPWIGTISEHGEPVQWFSGFITALFTIENKPFYYWFMEMVITPEASIYRSFATALQEYYNEGGTSTPEERTSSTDGVVKPADLYGWLLGKFEIDAIPKGYQEKILDNLKTVQWVSEKFENMTLMKTVHMYGAVVANIESEKMPPDILSLSCMYYNFTKAGLDTSKMRHLLNSSKFVDEAMKAMYKSMEQGEWK